MKYTNPVIPGFYPDPSICRYKDSFYLVNSSFQFFPGLPLFESRDLINWTQIGHVLTRESQLKLAEAGNSGGLYAPTIRVNNGRFYVVVTNVSHGGNLYVWTDDIHGEWSEPVYVDQDGIDPSLYFEDGHCYFMSNGTDDMGVGGIVQCEIDIETGKKLTPSRSIWQGTGGRYLEGPHLYKFGNEYYLLAAEGGTEYGHMVICAKGPTVYGPFTALPNNPILTNRNLGGYALQGVGHADITEDENGNLWMVHLAFRQIGQWLPFHTTGRECCLVPVTREDDGSLRCGFAASSRLEFDLDRNPLSDSTTVPVQKALPVYSFENTELGREWIFIREPYRINYAFDGEAYELFASSDKLSDALGHPTFMGIRQQQMKGRLEVTVEPGLGFMGCAGLSVYMDSNHHYDLFVEKTNDGLSLTKKIYIGDIEFEQKKEEIKSVNEVKLILDFEPEHYLFTVAAGKEQYSFGSNMSRYLSTEVACGFTGVLFGLFASGDNSRSGAYFKDFRLEYMD